MGLAVFNEKRYGNGVKLGRPTVKHQIKTHTNSIIDHLKKRPLGFLNYMKIWHDNSGKGDLASWFLKYIIVHDVQTREKFYFLCQQWLAVEKSDGKVERELFVANEKQKTDLKYLMQKEVTHNMSDSHLWYSIFARPVHSSFTRLDRVTCCFVLLFISMLFNIIYYDMDATTESVKSQKDGLHLGPFSLIFEKVKTT